MLYFAIMLFLQDWRLWHGTSHDSGESAGTVIIKSGTGSQRNVGLIVEKQQNRKSPLLDHVKSSGCATIIQALSQCFIIKLVHFQLRKSESELLDAAAHLSS